MTRLTRLTFKNYRTNEAFDKPYEWWADLITKNHLEYAFETHKKEKYYVIFILNDGENPNTTVSFTDEDGGYKMTDSGDAFRIFATVMEILYSQKEQLLSQGSIKFTAKNDEPSRIRLYDRMVKKYAKKIGYKNVTKSKSLDVLNYELSN